MLNGYVTLIVAAIWLIYQIVAKVIPDLQIPEQTAIEQAVNVAGDVFWPVIMGLLRLRTNSPVGSGVLAIPGVKLIAKE